MMIVVCHDERIYQTPIQYSAIVALRGVVPSKPIHSDPSWIDDCKQQDTEALYLPLC